MEIFDYDNILLLPRKCRVDSRSECDAGVDFGPKRFRIPVVPANMKTVVSESICIWLAQNGYFMSCTALTWTTSRLFGHDRAWPLCVNFAGCQKAGL
jgi:hypothetical protein